VRTGCSENKVARRLNIKNAKRGIISMIGLVAALAGSAAAQPIVIVGADDPNVDVSTVQAGGFGPEFQADVF
jgi:hypothetical protein